MSHRPRVVHGVQHARGCCCPDCDPGDARLAAAKVAAREQRARPAAVAAPIAAARWSASHRRPPAAGPDPRTKRLRELLATGVPMALALQTIDAETESTP